MMPRTVQGRWTRKTHAEFMITKILFTIAVVGTVFFASRYFAARQPPRGSARSRGGRPPMAVRVAAYAVIGLVLATAALWLALEWRDAHEIMRIQVINSATGKVAEYEAYRGDVEDRGFVTVGGRRVSLAEVERMEVDGR